MEIVIFLLGVIVGLIVAVTFSRWRTDGKLKIDHSNPEKDIYRIEIEDLDKLNKKTLVVLKVINKCYVSHD